MNTKRQTSPFNALANFLTRSEDISFQYLADQIGESFFLASQRTGLFRHFNRKALELTGYSREELERLSLSELITPNEAGETFDQIQRLEIGLSRNIQNVSLKTKSGQWVPVDLRITAAQGNDGEIVVLLLARDPIERTMVERAASHHHQGFSALQRISQLLTEQFDLPTEELYDQLLRACQDFTQADCIAIYHLADEPAGYQLREAINLPANFPASLGSADVAANGQPYDWRAGERPLSILSRLARNHHFSLLHVRPVENEQPPNALVVLVYFTNPFQTLDTGALAQTTAAIFRAVQQLQSRVSAQDEREENLNALQSLYDLWQRETSEGMLRVNVAGKVVGLNNAFEKLLGFRLKDSHNRPLEDVVISAQPVAQPILAALSQSARWGGVEADLVRRDGAAVAVYLRAIPLPDGGGLILVADRTDERQFQAQSDHLERRAWLGDLSAIFAHDVRNPLNGIATGLSYLANKYEADAPLYESVTKIQAEVNRIEQLLKNVLLVAKSNEINYQPVALQHLLDRILSRWGNRLARRNIQLEQDIDPRTPLALADVHQMDQVFTNLLVNAVDAMSNTGGTLSLKCHAATHAKTPHGDYVQITFVDTGPGISPEMQSKIFDPFVTTKSDGTGLGLAITKRIVTAHKGTIFVESYPGIGTTFFVFIPVAKRIPISTPV
jgi:PAS domain S-box-containing protein